MADLNKVLLGLAAGLKTYTLPKGWEFPTVNELLSRVGQEVIRSQEIHLWQVKFDRWMKLDSHFTFLNEKRLP